MALSNDPNPLFTLPPASDFLTECPVFRILVLGNAESTKVEIFSRVFGVDLPKSALAAAFGSSHSIDEPLDLEGQNARLVVHTSPNFGTGDEAAHRRVRQFLRDRRSVVEAADRVHCVWYCVACDEDRVIHGLEAEFFRHLDDDSDWNQPPVLLVFTKYDELAGRVRQDWLHEEGRRGVLSPVATSHLLRELATKHFESRIGRAWDAVVARERVPRVCVATDDDDDDEEGGYEVVGSNVGIQDWAGAGFGPLEALTATTLARLKEESVKRVFAAAQRNSPSISTQFCARAATRYFSVDTKHVRKQSGLEVGDILRDFYERAVQMFNLKDPGGLLAQPSMLSRVLAAALEPRQLGLVEDSMKDTDAAAVPVATTTTTSPKLVDGLSPHDRACLLVVAVAEILLVFHKLGEMQALRSGSRRNGAGGVSLTERRIEATLREVAAGTERVAVRETVEASRVFTQGFALGEVAELIARAVEQAERGDAAAGGSSSSRGGGGGRAPRSLVVEDDSELEEISLHFVNDRGPDETVLPNGMRVLVLN